MQGYDPKIDAAELVRRHGPEKAQQIIAEFMRDRGMSDRNSEIWSGLDVRTAQRGMEPSDLSDGMAGAPQSTVGDDAGLDGQDGSGRDWGNWSPGMPLPAEGPDKSVLADNARRAREAERVAANSRERNEAIGQKYGPKAQEIAEAGDARGVTDYDATRKPINQQRLNDRREIEAAVDAGVGGAQSDLRELNQAGATKRKEFRDLDGQINQLLTSVSLTAAADYQAMVERLKNLRERKAELGNEILDASVDAFDKPDVTSGLVMTACSIAMLVLFFIPAPFVDGAAAAAKALSLG